MKTFITILLLALLNSSACTNAKEDTTTTLATKTVTTFTDVNEKTNYHEAIQYLLDNNIVGGYSDGTFKPENKINRAELLKILLEIKDKEAVNTANLSNCFTDVKNEWFAPYVCYAKDKGIIKGYADGSFKPEQNIAFTEAAKMITNIMGLEVAKVEENAPWYKQYVLPLTENKRVPRSITTFDKELTRGEMAEMVWRVREEIEKSEDWVSYEGIELKIIRNSFNDWITFENKILKLQHPKEIFLEEIDDNILLYRIANEDYNYPAHLCYGLLGKYNKVDQKIDFGLEVKIFQGTLKDAVNSIDPNINNFLYNYGSGYTTDYFVAENCGFFINFQNIDNDKILITKTYSVFEINAIDQKKYLEFTEKNQQFITKILSTLILLDK